MSTSIGGALIKDLSLTYSWGGTPGSASVTAKGSSTLTAGDSVMLTIDALAFYGIIVGDPTEVTDSEGATIKFSVVDNRELLKEDIVLCRFNKMIIIEDDPATPGIDRTKKYEHIYPGDDWEAQKKTVTSQPHTAREVLDKMFLSPTVAHTWSRTYYSAQAKACHEIDCNHGKKLLNAITEVTESQGLIFTLVGESSLVWGRKGTDVPPTPNTTTDYNRSSGHSLNTNDTRITIVGDPNRYQELSIALEADWARPWEAFWLESDWLEEVNTRFGPYTNDDSGQATLAAKARTVTVREYVGLVDATFADYGKMGDVVRMELPAWIYLTRVVWHAYRVPRTYTINGIPLENLSLVEEMLLAVVVDIDSGIITAKTPDELYPDGYGFVAAQGQQLGLVDPRTQRYLTPDQLDHAREKWTQMNRFTVDKKNKVVFFEEATFLPGTDAEALFLFPNQDVSGIDETDPLYNLCVPNQAMTVEPAVVKASLTFDAELFSMAYGSGRRMGADYVSGLNYHSILDEGANVRQIDYDDGKGAEDKAADYAASKISNDPTYLMGGFDRKGAAGTALNTSIDRVTITSGIGGVNERLDYTKERGPSHFIAEDELRRRQQEKDRYPGERKLQQEVRDLQGIAALSTGGPRRLDGVYTSANDVVQRPVGCEHSAPRLITMASEQRAGTPVFINEAGAPDLAGRGFAGVVIADGAQGRGVALATQGVIPVRVNGPFALNDPVGMEADGTVKVNGEKLFGAILGSYSGSETVLVQVRLGGSGAEKPRGPFALISLSADGLLKLSPGTINQLIPDNPFAPIDCSAADLTFVKLHATTDSYQVNGAAYAASGTPTVPAAATKGAPPLDFDVTLAMVRKLTAMDSTVSYSYYPVWPAGFNIVAAPQEWLQTDRTPIAPGQTSREIWYSWQAMASYVGS